MLLKGRSFDGARRYFNTDMSLWPVVGNGSCFNEFQTQRFIGLAFIFQNLKQLFRHDICCHVMGSFPAYISGFITSFQKFEVFIDLRDNTMIDLIFQRCLEVVRIFGIGAFVFTFEQVMVGIDICRYRVRRGEFEVEMVFVDIDSTVPCGNYSNVYFVHFVWQHLEQFRFQRHDLTFLPDPSTGYSQLLCLRH